MVGRGWLAAIVVASTAGALPACSFTPGAFVADATGADEDTSGGGSDADVTTGWSEPVKIPSLDHPTGNDDPSLTDDLLQIYFGSYRQGGEEDIWYATRASVNDEFGEPVPAFDLNTSFAETTARITGNGKAIYFASNRLGGNFDIYVATRTEVDQPWSTPSRIMELSSANGDWAPYATTDQLRLILCSGPTEAQEALYVATRTNPADTWSNPARVSELDEPTFSECDPIEPRANVLYYSSDHLGGASETFDIYRASRSTSGALYGNRTPLSINLVGFHDRDPWVSPDERTLVFSSDRDGVNTQIYISTRR